MEEKDKEEIVFDTESPIPLADDDHPDIEEIEKEEEDAPFREQVNESISEQLETVITNGFMWGQEVKGTRKYISVAPPGEEREFEVMLDDGPMSPTDIDDALIAAGRLFAPFILAVDEYKDGNKKKFAISQATEFKGKDLIRTIAEVRVSAAREIYGFLVNAGASERVMLLNTVKTVEEKRELKKPFFFNSNAGYSAP
jgi:hypothetical protein